ncbi:MAG: ribonuclease III [Gammaproteobacteria bacterium]|jgi:ribonuclease-3
MEQDLSELMHKIDYKFKDIALLKTALSHRSCGKVNNERLEFLGDSLVNFVVANELFKLFPEAQEGQLSRLRAYLVRGETLAEIAKEFDLSRYIKLGVGEFKSGGAYRVSILSDAVEAIIGAMFLDSDLETCYAKVTNWYQQRLGELSLEEVYKDPKSLLQELVQAKQLPLPEYDLVKITGKEHKQKFIVECKIALLNKPVQGEGTSRRKAEQAAASAALEELKDAED